MNNRWRRCYRLGEYTKLGPTIKRLLILGRRFQNHCCNPLHQVSGKGQSIMRLNTDDLIELAETGKTENIELDSMAKVVLHECLYMLKFEKKYYTKGNQKNV